MQKLHLAFNYLYVSPCQLPQALGLEKWKQWVEVALKVGYLGLSTSLNMEAALLTMKIRLHVGTHSLTSVWEVSCQ